MNECCCSQFCIEQARQSERYMAWHGGE